MVIHIEMPIFSFIIPTFNCIDALKEFLSQFNVIDVITLEIIIVDANSQDGTAHFLTSLSSKNLKWISEPDQGLYDAMNKGIALSTGDYLCFMGTDDRINPAVFTSVSELLQSSNPDLIYGLAKNGYQQKLYGQKHTIDTLSIPGQIMPHGAVFYHRSLIDKIGLFDLRYPIAADVVFNLKALSSSHLPQFIDSVFYTFSGEGVSKDAIDRNFYKDIDIILERISEVKDEKTQKKIAKSRKYYKVINEIIFKNWFTGFCSLFYYSLPSNNTALLKHGLYHIRIRLFRKRKFF